MKKTRCSTLSRNRSSAPSREFAGQRDGLSLLEVIIATVVLSVSAAMLVRLISNAERQANRADRRVHAQMICQNKLDELLAELEPLESFDPRPSLYYPDWHYSVSVQEFGDSSDNANVNFSLVEVSVYYQESGEELGETTPVSLDKTDPVYTLRRIVRTRPKNFAAADSGLMQQSLGEDVQR